MFIAAKNSYYAFSICPGFWDCLVHLHGAGAVCSIDRVKAELLTGRKTEDLVQWVKAELPGEFFAQTGEKPVVDAYAQVMLWVQRNSPYYDQAKAKFATEADGWLVAYALVHGVTVITNEQPRPESRNRILLPDVCDHFKVDSQDTFFMLEDLGVRFEWTGQS